MFGILIAAYSTIWLFLMFGVGFSEILLILIVAFLLFGPEKLQEFAHSLGEILRVIRKEYSDIKSSIDTSTQTTNTSNQSDHSKSNSNSPSLSRNVLG